MILRNSISAFATASLTALALVTGCSSPSPDDALEASDLALSAAKPVAITPLTAPTILGLDVSGDACPVNSVATNISDDKHAATVTFSKALVSGTHCALHFRMAGVPGVRVGLPVAHLRGFRPDGAKGLIRTTETLSGARITPRSTYRPADHERDWVYSLARTGDRANASSDCGRKALDYTLDVSFEQLAKNGGVALDSIDFGFTYMEGAIFRGCDNRVLQSAPSADGETCGGLSAIPCASGLLCSATSGDLGTCADPSDAGPAPSDDGGSDQ